jgi:hypothetical protein
MRNFTEYAARAAQLNIENPVIKKSGVLLNLSRNHRTHSEESNDRSRHQSPNFLDALRYAVVAWFSRV